MFYFLPFIVTLKSAGKISGNVRKCSVLSYKKQIINLTAVHKRSGATA